MNGIKPVALEKEAYLDQRIFPYNQRNQNDKFLLKAKENTNSQNAKNPAIGAGFGIMWRRPTLPGVTPVPSALQGLTSLFGMGRGGTPALGRLICKYTGCGKQ